MASCPQWDVPIKIWKMAESSVRQPHPAPTMQPTFFSHLKPKQEKFYDQKPHENKCFQDSRILHCISVFFFPKKRKCKQTSEKACSMLLWNTILLMAKMGKVECEVRYAWIGPKSCYCPQPPSYFVFINIFFSLSFTFTFKQGIIFMTKRYIMKVSSPPSPWKLKSSSACFNCLPLWLQKLSVRPLGGKTGF